MDSLKLYMVLLGCEVTGRHTEQHDIFFGIAPTLADLVPQIKVFWPESKKIHIDAWREVNSVNGYKIVISPKNSPFLPTQQKKLFFMNLGGYRQNRFEEQHHILLTVEASTDAAIRKAKSTSFFEENQFAGAKSHIDDKY